MGRDSRRTRLLLIGLLVVALALLTIDYRVRGKDSRLRDAVHNVVGPVERGVAAAIRPIRHAFDTLGDSDAQRRRADQLQAQVLNLQRQLAAAGQASAEGGQLESLRRFADAASYSIVAAHVVAVSDTTGTERTVDIDAGRNGGIAPRQIVVASDGLVGVVTTVGADDATVRLLTDPHSVVGARLEQTQALGTVTGTGDPHTLAFTLYDPSLPVTVGERLVTFGSRDYPPGVPIGEVTRVDPGGPGLTRRADVRMFAQLGSLDLVGVVVAHPAANPGDSLLPPRPTPAPSQPVPASTPAPTPVAGRPTQVNP